MRPTRWHLLRIQIRNTATLPWSIVSYLVWRTWRNIVNPIRTWQAWRAGNKLVWQPRHSEGPDYHIPPMGANMKLRPYGNRVSAETDT